MTHKKVISLTLTTLLALALAACASTDTNKTSQGTDTSTNSSSSTTSSSQQTITEESAIETALADAGLSASDVTNLWVELDLDKDQATYEVDFDYKVNEYSYSIDRTSGDIVEKSTELKEADVETGLSQEKAKEKALTDAGFTEADVKYIKVSLDKDDISVAFEVDFIVDDLEYSYSVDAETGVILEKETESINR